MFIDQTDPRIGKTLKLSRTLQNLTVLYASLLAICDCVNTESAGYLTNLAGHSAANIILFAKIFILSHKFEEQQVKTKFQECIGVFEINSYGEELTDTSDIVTRMQHNNQILMMLQAKVGRNVPEFQIKIRHFLKKHQRSDYSCSQMLFFLFEYMACFLHMSNLARIMPKLDTAPPPFLPPANKKYTLVIDPENVLIFKKNSKVYLRSYTTQFLQFVEAYCEIVLWTSYLPVEFEQMLDLVDSEKRVSYKLYKYHCVYVKVQ